jgi:serine/threonine-protein kinase
MATVHVGRLTGEAGFKRTVAIKRLHPQYARNKDFVGMFVEEARLAARVQHPNVVSVFDVVAEDGELFLVMEYVHGESLANLLRAARVKNDPPPTSVVAHIVTGVLYGLHAAHEARSDRGEPLEIVHRDMSPQNILVGVEGVARVLDFGVAKAVQRATGTTKEEFVRGKISYMPPEQLDASTKLDRRVDVYAAAVVLWECLAGRQLYPGTELGPLVREILTAKVPRPSSVVAGLPPGIDEVVLKGLARDRGDRYATALEMARAIEDVVPPVPIREVSAWVNRIVDDGLRHRTEVVSAIEKLSLPPPSDSPDVPSSGDPASPPRPKHGSGARVLVASVVVGACLVVLVGVVLALRRTAHSSSTSTSTSTSPAPSISGSPSGTSSVEPPASTIPKTIEPAASASASGPGSASASAPSRTVVGATRKRPPPAKPSAQRQCDPPWTIDEKGVRVLKRECL